MTGGGRCDDDRLDSAIVWLHFFYQETLPKLGLSLHSDAVVEHSPKLALVWAMLNIYCGKTQLAAHALRLLKFENIQCQSMRWLLDAMTLQWLYTFDEPISNKDGTASSSGQLSSESLIVGVSQAFRACTFQNVSQLTRWMAHDPPVCSSIPASGSSVQRVIPKRMR